MCHILEASRPVPLLSDINGKYLRDKLRLHFGPGTCLFFKGTINNYFPFALLFHFLSNKPSLLLEILPEAITTSNSSELHTGILPLPLLFSRYIPLSSLFILILLSLEFRYLSTLLPNQTRVFSSNTLCDIASHDKVRQDSHSDTHHEVRLDFTIFSARHQVHLELELQQQLYPS